MTLKQGPKEPLMTYVRCFNDETMQVNDYTDQAALQATMNGLQLCTFKWEISKKMLKTLSGLMKEAQRQTIVEALYYTKDTYFSRPEARKSEGGPSRLPQLRSPKSSLNKGKKSGFE